MLCICLSDATVLFVILTIIVCILHCGEEKKTIYMASFYFLLAFICVIKTAPWSNAHLPCSCNFVTGLSKQMDLLVASMIEWHAGAYSLENYYLPKVPALPQAYLCTCLLGKESSSVLSSLLQPSYMHNCPIKMSFWNMVSKSSLAVESANGQRGKPAAVSIVWQLYDQACQTLLSFWKMPLHMAAFPWHSLRF